MKLFWEVSIIVIKCLRHSGSSEISWYLYLKILVLLSPKFDKYCVATTQALTAHACFKHCQGRKCGNVMSLPKSHKGCTQSTTANSSPCIVRLPVAGNGNELKHELDTRQLEKNLCWVPVKLCWTILNQELHHLHNLLMSIGAGLQGRHTIRSQGLQTCTSNSPLLGFNWKLHLWD